MIVVLWVIAFLPRAARAMPCCSGGSSSATLMTSQEKAQVSLSLVENRVMGDVDSDGQAVYRNSDDQDVQQIFSLSVSKSFFERLQAGIRVPMVMTTRQGQSQTTLGDLGLTIGYEWFPEFRYKQVPTKSFVYLTQSVPTGQSILDSTGGPSQVSGTGFYTTGVGIHAYQRISKRWDMSFNFETRASLPGQQQSNERSAQSVQSSQTVRPGIELNPALGFSFFLIPNRWRAGYRLSPNYRAPGTLRPESLAWDSQVDTSYGFDQTSLRVSYLDQTWMGPALNTTLSRSILFTWTQAWER